MPCAEEVILLILFECTPVTSRLKAICKYARTTQKNQQNSHPELASALRLPSGLPSYRNPKLFNREKKLRRSEKQPSKEIADLNLFFCGSTDTKMGKRYYCDYCDRSFIDDIRSRKKHLTGTAHVRNRKIHYESCRGQFFSLI